MTTKTLDDRKVFITAQVGPEEKLSKIAGSGADGIGLLEAECPHNLSPVEAEDQYFAFFREAAQTPGQVPVTLLLPDLGAEINGPVPKVRGIRHLLSSPGMYTPFLRAVLRAGTHGCYELALPMVSQVAEVLAFKEIMGEVRARLESEGIGCSTPSAGVVVEAPSVIPAIKTLMFESIFFLIGQNYVKYLMADQSISGEREQEAYFSQAFMLQSLAMVESLKGRKGGARISAPAVRDPVAVPILVGMGFNHLVAPPEMIPAIKGNVESISFREVCLIASKTTSYWDPHQAREYARERLARLKSLPGPGNKKT
ncbi:MAG: hypothetical protein JL50_13380 [Peptococcaceae bacterium BICA1-7]|nr:MAG: hypothetical protein JL50_13380 [Peptococcaceae bacterium BICA1-7]HBV99550.1 hypothetical protein [Desulfotomaculum sp.]